MAERYAYGLKIRNSGGHNDKHNYPYGGVAQARPHQDAQVDGLERQCFFTLAARQVVAQQRIPFEIKATAPVMTEETRRALVEAEAKMLGLLPDDGVSFSSGAEAVAWLEDE